ncbi:hypothetical protein Mpsy_0833 [Methanolobus psychrophilus R15]|nr:hypothetical protein Mpsy_0833 [Methanolobus psychrophilus R15]
MFLFRNHPTGNVQFESLMNNYSVPHILPVRKISIGNSRNY